MTALRRRNEVRVRWRALVRTMEHHAVFDEAVSSVSFELYVKPADPLNPNIAVLGTHSA